jgi:hypothetical protein
VILTSSDLIARTIDRSQILQVIHAQMRSSEPASHSLGKSIIFTDCSQGTSDFKPGDSTRRDYRGQL